MSFCIFDCLIKSFCGALKCSFMRLLLTAVCSINKTLGRRGKSGGHAKEFDSMLHKKYNTKLEGITVSVAKHRILSLLNLLFLNFSWR